MSRSDSNAGGHSYPEQRPVKKKKHTRRFYLTMWMKPSSMLCLEGRVGHLSRAHRFTAQARKQDEKHNGSFFSNPSPPSTGRRAASSQRHHCSATLPPCFSLATDALVVFFIQDDPFHSVLTLMTGAHSPFIFLAHSSIVFTVSYTCMIPQH